MKPKFCKWVSESEKKRVWKQLAGPGSRTPEFSPEKKSLTKKSSFGKIKKGKKGLGHHRMLTPEKFSYTPDHMVRL